ncbi:MAG TPA: hypothetical protein VKV24_10735, partial [Casimicrobiaceae bacterium]|nr:hypothetical protein [Casimicrobiaceae bacterium]
MSAYLQKLRQTDLQLHTDNVQTRLSAWLSGLPEFGRQRLFSMAEFEQALGRPGRLISPALLA